MVAEEEKYKKTKGLGYHACKNLTSVVWNKTPTIIIYQKPYSGATTDSSAIVSFPEILLILP